jgi:hypothetical protein
MYILLFDIFTEYQEIKSMVLWYPGYKSEMIFTGFSPHAGLEVVGDVFRYFS